VRILTFGTFDDLHPGHRAYLSQAQARGELCVVVARDANVMRIKGRVPLQDEEARARAVRDAFPGATVLLGDAVDFLSPVRSIKPDLILLGYDQKLPPGVDEAMFGCQVERASPHRPDIHKSSLRRAKKQN
jgi:FAD synthetase